MRTLASSGFISPLDYTNATAYYHFVSVVNAFVFNQSSYRFDVISTCGCYVIMVRTLLHSFCIYFLIVGHFICFAFYFYQLKISRSASDISARELCFFLCAHHIYRIPVSSFINGIIKSSLQEVVTWCANGLLRLNHRHNYTKSIAPSLILGFRPKSLQERMAIFIERERNFHFLYILAGVS